MRHQIFLQRFVGTARKTVESHLEELHKAAKLAIATGQTGVGLKQTLKESIRGLQPEAIKQLSDLAKYEAKFSAKLIAKKLKEKVANVEEEKLIRTLLNETIQLQNGSDATKKGLAFAYKQFANRKAAEIAQVIQDGQTNSLGMQEIASNVGARINGQHKAQAKVLSKTAVNYAAAVAREEAIAASTVEKVIWVLGDAGVHTDYCLAQEGQVYDVNEGPRPPAHWGCVSYMEPYVE